MGTTNTLSLLLQAEELPLNLASDPVRVSLLQQAMTPVYLKLINEAMMDVVVCFLLGQFYVKWSPLWKTVTSLLDALATTQAKRVWRWTGVSLYSAGGYCDNDEKWYSEGMKEEEEEEEEEEEKDVKNRYEERVRHAVKCAELVCARSSETPNEVAIAFGWVAEDYHWMTLLYCLAAIHGKFMPFNREFMNLFFLFLRDGYFAHARKTDPFLAHYEGNAKILNPSVFSIAPAMGNREGSRRLKAFLKLFENLKDAIKNCYGAPVLRDVLMYLLTKNDTETQKAAVTILCCFPALGSISSPSQLKPYKEQLLMMCDDVQFKECVTTFFLSPDEGMILKEQRKEVIRVVSRILYGRLLGRSYTKVPIAVRHASVLSYLSTVTEEELAEFVGLTVCRFFDDLSVPVPTSTAMIDAEVAKLEKNDRVQSNHMVGVLTLLYDIVKHLSLKLKKYVHLYLILLAFFLKRITRELTALGEKEEESDEEDEEEKDEEDEEEEDEKEKKNQSQMQQLRRVRTLCLKRLTEMIGYFSYLDFTIYSPYFFAPLARQLQLLPTSCRHATHTPVLVHLCNIVSSNNNLFYIFDLQPLLLPQCLLCLKSDEEVEERRNKNGLIRGIVERGKIGHLSNTVAVEIVQIVENLLEIDPENDYFNEKKKKKRLRAWKTEKEDLTVMSQNAVLHGGEAMDVESTLEGIQFILPHVNMVVEGVEYLLRVIHSLNGSLFTRLLSIIYHLAELASKKTVTLAVPTLAHVLNLLISFIKYSANKDEVQDNKMRVLDSITSLVPLVEDYDTPIRALSALLIPGEYCVNAFNLRKRIVSVFGLMAGSIPAFADTVPLMKDLHATSDNTIGGYSFAKRGDAYDVIVKKGLFAYDPKSVSFLPLFACVLKDATDEDMMIRTTAMKCLKELVERMAKEEWCEVYEQLLMMIMGVIKYVVKTVNNDNVRRPIVSLLRTIVILWKDHPSLDLCSDLIVLIDETNDDNDVILNLIDIKTRTRVNGLRRINKYVKEVDAGEKPRLSASTLRNILIPLLMSYVKEYSKAAGVKWKRL